MDKVGQIIFGTICLDVYGSLDEPWFLAKDVADILQDGSVWGLTALCEADEIKKDSVIIGKHARVVKLINESGLYNILAQSRRPIARGWRRIVHDQLIDIRRKAGKNIEEQFTEWDAILDTLYFDEETGMIMQSVTVAGGDVEQIPFE